MPTAAIHAPPGDTSSAMPQQHLQQQQQQSRPALRRAVYIHVSDVITNAYNIDHAKLEEELSRVRASPLSTTAAGSSRHTTPESPATTATAALDRSLPPEIMDTAAAGTLPASSNATTSKRLVPPRGGFNLCVLVGKVQVVVDKRRVDGSRVRLAEVEVGDETGTVSLRARDGQIDVLLQVSQQHEAQKQLSSSSSSLRHAPAVVLRNCTLELFQGKHIRLAITKWGKLSLYPDSVASTPPPPSKMNLDRNFSLIDLSLVACEATPQPGGTSVVSTATVGTASSSQPLQQQLQHHHQLQGQTATYVASEKTAARGGSGGGGGAGRLGGRRNPRNLSPGQQPILTSYDGMMAASGVGGGGMRYGVYHQHAPAKGYVPIPNEADLHHSHHHLPHAAASAAAGGYHPRYGPPPQQALGGRPPGPQGSGAHHQYHHQQQQQQQQQTHQQMMQHQFEIQQHQHQTHLQQMYEHAHPPALFGMQPNFDPHQHHLHHQQQLNVPNAPPDGTTIPRGGAAGGAMGYRAMNPQAATFDPRTHPHASYNKAPPPASG